MALVPKLFYSIDTQGTRLVVRDITGEYSAVDNTSGWGVGNPATAGSPQPYLKDISYAVLEITKSGGTTYTIDLISDLSTTFDASTVLNDLVYAIDNTYLGLSSSTKIPDGKYTVTYKLSDNATYGSGGNDVTATFYIGIYENIESKIMDLVEDIDEYYTYDNCNNNYINNLVDIWALYTQMQWSAQYGDMDKFENILSTLNDLDELQ